METRSLFAAESPTRRPLRGKSRPKRCGFSLVELVVVLLIIGILAAVAVGRFFTVGDNAEIGATLRQVDIIEKAALDVYAGSGAWPAEASDGVFPPEFKGYMPSDLFTEPTPVGGLYDWNGESKFADMYAGISIKHQGTNDTRPMSKWQAIDDMVDDGNLKTGRVFVYNDLWLCFETVPTNQAPLIKAQADAKLIGP